MCLLQSATMLPTTTTSLMKPIAIILIFFMTRCLSHLYLRPNCNGTTSNCSYTSYLKIHLKPNEIHLLCSKPFSPVDPEDVRSFNAKQLRSIDDSSLLNLATMAKKCHNTKVKQIKYAIDINKVQIIRVTRNLIGEDNHLEYLNIQIDDKSEEIKNITVFDDDFLKYGTKLKTIVINNAKINVLRHYFKTQFQIETIDLASNQIEQLEQGAFQNLPKLQNVILRQNLFKDLNHNFEMLNLTYVDISMNTIQNLTRTTFYKTNNLKFLNLSDAGLKTIDFNTFDKFSGLETLDLSYNANLTLKEHVFANLTSLKSLNISSCRLTDIPVQFLYRSKHLDVLNISTNLIRHLDENTLHNLTKLRIVDLSWNNLETLPKSLLNTLENLREIYLRGNKMATFDSEIYWKVPKLEIIDLNHNRISASVNSDRIFRCSIIDLGRNRIRAFPIFLLKKVHELVYLDVSDNEIERIDLMKEMIPKNRNVRLAIDLTNNQIEELNISNPDSTHTENETNNWLITMELSQNKLRCNCLHYQIEKAPKNEDHTAIVRLTDQESVCYTRYPSFNCPLIHISNCPSKCNCFYTRSENAINVNCSSRGLKRFPEIKDIRTSSYKHDQLIVDLSGNLLNLNGQELLRNYSNMSVLDLSNNKIEELKYLPPTVEELRLDNNSLSLLSENVVKQLEHSEAIESISLNNNPWKCDCDSLMFQQYLIKYNNIKVNQSTVLCKGTFDQLVYRKICETQKILKIALPVVFAVAALLALTVAVYYKYSMEIKVYLYSRNMCLWFVAEDDLDKDKIYDVFISFHHKDENFVANHLLPGLDPFYKICIHTRDFTPGAYISDQIVNSIHDSRRTLVVLTEDFLESTWGMMEFRVAHAQAEEEKRIRVIIVLPNGPLKESLLDDDLKAYLKTNTYVSWDDAWFWKKLKYALPHSKLKTNRPRRLMGQQSVESFHLR
ncbi:protein toll-like isoform X2 [Anthonomus grandis grandis]|uniref:protein toll-like isoform X2 n=1 Tax=Anthonomus grandis grandis TaxID=2921223 RepID=UPI00216649A5|nr:protein toll-like isoform X2 [Anthonomus grandis grandis]